MSHQPKTEREVVLSALKQRAATEPNADLSLLGFPSISGRFSLCEMIREVEINSALGKKIVHAYAEHLSTQVATVDPTL